MRCLALLAFALLVVGCRDERPPPPPLEDSCAAICVKNAGCGQLTGADARLYQAKCMQTCVERGDGDAASALVVRNAMARVAATCNGVTCEKFGACYLDALQRGETQPAETLTKR